MDGFGCDPCRVLQGVSLINMKYYGMFATPRETLTLKWRQFPAMGLSTSKFFLASFSPDAAIEGVCLSPPKVDYKIS